MAGNDSGGKHDDKSQHDGAKPGGGSGRFEKPQDTGKHGDGKGGKK